MNLNLQWAGPMPNKKQSCSSIRALFFSALSALLDFGYSMNIFNLLGRSSPRQFKISWLGATAIGALLLFGCGGGGSAPTTSDGSSVAAKSTISVFAGNLGGPGYIDATGTAARFGYINAMATDSSGHIYVADNGSSSNIGYSFIRKITPAGIVTTLAGSAIAGGTDGIGGSASFNYPNGIATDKAGNVYVADTSNCAIRKITSAGVVSTLAGKAGICGSVPGTGSADGTGTSARFSFPTGVATDQVGNVYVADTQHCTIRKITAAGVVTTLAGSAYVCGTADGNGPTANFDHPWGVATDSAGNVYVTDSYNSTIRKITPAGLVSTFAGTPSKDGGNADGTGSAARFSFPRGIATDGADNIYVDDFRNSTIRKITLAGVVTTISAAPSPYFDRRIAVDAVGNVYSSHGSTVLRLSPAGVVTTLAGKDSVSGNADGAGAAATFSSPTGITTDNVGNVYVADAAGSTIRKIAPVGVVTTLAGKAFSWGHADGTCAAATLMTNGVATDSVGNVYVAESSNTVRKITSGCGVTTLAGSGAFGFADGMAMSASFSNPQGIAADTAGNVYLTDTYNNTVRKVTPAGVVITLAGTPGLTGSADGLGTAASFNRPWGIAIDSDGNIYVADSGNRTIRKISVDGVVSTLAGSPGIIGSADGVGAAASFGRPLGLATDAGRNVYVADEVTHTIRKITPDGLVNTVVGVTGQNGFLAGDLPGSLSFPQGVAISGSSLYITTSNGVAVVNNRP